MKTKEKKLGQLATHRGARHKAVPGARPTQGGRLSTTPTGRSLDSAKIDAAYVGFHKTFADRRRALSMASPLARRLGIVVKTDNVLDRNVWLSKRPKMRRWIGDKVLYKFRGESHPIQTDPHEASVQVPKIDIKNDKLGLYKDEIAAMGDAYEEAINDLYFALLAAGIAGTSLGTTFDGQNLVDTDHTALSAGGTAQSNKVTGALSTTTFDQAMSKYLGFLDENGMPMNLAGRRMNLVVGPANRQLARTILDQNVKATGESNIDAGDANLIVTPWLTARTTQVNGTSVTITGTEWALIPDNSSSIIIHEKTQDEFLSVEDGEFVFRTGNFLYGVEAEFGGGYGLWQEIVGGPGA